MQNSEDRRVTLENEIDVLRDEAKRMRHNKEIARVKKKDMEKHNKWILEECANFGKRGTDFDFDKHPRDLVKKKADEYEKKLESMDGKVNKTVTRAICNGIMRKQKELTKKRKKYRTSVGRSSETAKAHRG
eukprot:TRINITY_DN1577_c0_g2_i2.p2 TRINITY_DN1577_c0_g2~~TRINITY_DN1577_c0_g2_i2.p2  ORF type:complete len:131 (-),score=48.60 TRINITY_DN1577_c0_g2_i2:2-394(-)